MACESRHSAGTCDGSPVAATARQPAVPRVPLDTAALLHRALGAQGRGYVFSSFTTGDLNHDQRPDFLALFRSAQVQDATTGMPDTYACRVAVVLNRGFPRLELAAVNDHVVECLGGGCPHEGAVIAGSSFSFTSLDGLCTKTRSEQTFRYSPQHRTWLLEKESDEYYSCHDSIPVGHGYRERTRRDFGTVTFADY
ncbi:hypothetical protein [Hymenobacter arizonensis]|uniref:hypothetical protein n=1 Tax=Hymenobacter arizonensis TaxID=1227077 RepID=UPI0011601810|nr:hypothetical protein [Hymenobacter arizonensis]